MRKKAFGTRLSRIAAMALSALLLHSPLHAQVPAKAEPESHLTAAQMFALADAARDRADYATADAAYRALATNPDLDLRCEARFRLALMLADKQHLYREAAIELRKILDERPRAARVRLELARIDALLGRTGAAARELRAAEAGGLPPEVEQSVRFFAQALDTSRRVGGNIELGLAPDSNVNRATASGTLSTVVGDLTLSRDARARSGLGLTARGQGFARLPVSAHTSLLGRLSTSGNLYRSSDFNDIVLAPQLGPEFSWGGETASIGGGPAWRWYGGRLYTSSTAVSGDWKHVTGRRAQLRINATFAQIRNHYNALESGNAMSLAVDLDRSFSPRFGGGIEIVANRQEAHDRGYATAGGGISTYLFREVSKTTVAVNLGYSHLEADRRLFLFTRRRIDHAFEAGLSGIFRQIRIGSISPLMRVRYEYNDSSVQIYRYRRFAGELGIATAF